MHNKSYFQMLQRAVQENEQPKNGLGIMFVDKSDDVGEIFILGGIYASKWSSEEMTPKEFRDEITKAGNKKDVHIHINSPGGEVFSAVTIMNMIRKMKAKTTVFVDGIAASSASVVAMGGDQVVMSPGSMMMIHNPSTVAIGDAEDFRALADTLDKVRDAIIESYQTRVGGKITNEEIEQLMADETWMSAEEAVEKGFADSVDGAPAAEPVENTDDLDIYDRAVAVMKTRLRIQSL